MRQRKGILERAEDGFDRLAYHLGKMWDFAIELSGDLYRKLSELFASAISTTAVWLINSMIPPKVQARSRFVVFLLRLIGFPLVIVAGICAQAFLLGYGLLGAIVGMRRGREYLFTENLMTWIPLLVAALILPWLNISDYAVTQLTLFVSYSIIVLGLNILLGIAGQPSLGHGAFVLVGGYVSAILFTGGMGGLQINNVVAVVAGGVFAAILGFLIGYPAARVRGPYLTLITLGLMMSLSPVLKHHSLASLSGGTDGLSFEQPRPPTWLSFIPTSTWSFYFALMFFVVMFICAHILIRRSKIGRALSAIHDGEERTNVLGINEAFYKALAFALSALYAGIGGGIATLQLGYISPDSVTFHDSMDYLVALVVGGRGGLFGSVIGGAFMTYQHVFVSWLTSKIHNGDQLVWGIYGIMLVIVMIFAPRGVAGAINHFLFLRRFSYPTRRKHRRDVFPDYDLEEELLVVGSSELVSSAVAKTVQSREAAP